MPKSEYYKFLEELKNKNNDAAQFLYKKYIDNVVNAKILKILYQCTVARL
jgi:hypothetical protein